MVLCGGWDLTAAPIEGCGKGCQSFCYRPKAGTVGAYRNELGIENMDLLSIGSLLIAFLGVGVGLYQGFEKKRLDQYVKNQAWHNYALAMRALASQQAVLKKYKDESGDNIDKDMFEQLTRAESFLHSLYFEAIRQIQLSERTFDMNTVRLWRVLGRITESQEKTFLETAPYNPPGILQTLRIWIQSKIQEKLGFDQTKASELEQLFKWK